MPQGPASGTRSASPHDGTSRGEPRPLSRLDRGRFNGGGPGSAEEMGGSAPAFRSAPAPPHPPGAAGDGGERGGTHTKVIAGGDPCRY